MSGTNSGAAASIPDITLDELERLIRLLGMLGSEHDGEVVNAARLALRWMAEKGTDWRALLTPEPELAVVGVAVADEARVQRDEINRLKQEVMLAESREKAAYRKGVGDGMVAMGKQLKAQAATLAQPGLAGMAAQPVQPLSAGAAQTAAGGWNVSATSFAQTHPGVTLKVTPQAPSAPPPSAFSGANPWPAGGWQYVAWELLASTVPGIFRGSRERDFVSDVLKRGFPKLTAGQENWLRDIAGRVGMSW